MKIAGICLISILVLLAGFMGYRIHAQSSPVYLSHEDLLVWQRDRARVSVIQLQAKPITDELNKLSQKWCQSGNVAIDQCMIDDETGLVYQSKPKK